MIPISSALFAYPQLDKWIFPLGFRYILAISLIFGKTFFLTKQLLSIFLTNSSPFLEHVSNLYWRFVCDWAIQAIAVIYYYAISMTLASFFIGMGLYVHALVMDLRQRMDDLHNHETNATKMSCLVDGFKFHGQILKLNITLFGV